MISSGASAKPLEKFRKGTNGEQRHTECRVARDLLLPSVDPRRYISGANKKRGYMKDPCEPPRTLANPCDHLWDEWATDRYQGTNAQYVSTWIQC